EEWEKYAAVDAQLREHFHEPAERLTGDELAAREPALQPGLAGAWYYPGDAHLRPDKLMTSWRRVLEKSGVAFRENEHVTGWSPGRDGGKRTLATSRGELRADAFVFASGALTPRLSKLIGCRIPIQPGKGYSITMPRPALCPRAPLIFPEHRVAITPMQS